MRAWVVGMLVAAAAAAGCTGGSDDGGPDDGLGAVPPGCDAARPAVAHRAGGVLVEDPMAPVPIPCASYVGARGAEPTIGVTAMGGVFYYGSTEAGFGVARTFDEGATWDFVTPTVNGQSTHPTTFDPYFYVDPTTSRLFADDLLPAINCSIFSWSDDDGETWDHSYSGCAEFDHQTIFAGPPTTSMMLDYPNVVYRCAINTVALAGLSTSSTCQRSIDGGRSWLAPGEPAFVTPAEALPDYCDGALGHGFVDTTGRVWLPKGLCAQPWIAWSDDEGLTWTRVQVATNGMNREQDGVYPGHEAGVGVDPDGNVYYLWVAEDRLPYLAVSTDSGASWSEPRMVGAPGVNEASLPALIVGGVGKVAFAYMGTTNSPGAPFPTSSCSDPVVCLEFTPVEGYDETTWSGYMAVSYDALADDATFYSAPINDPSDPLIRGTCGAVRCQEVFDFIDVRIAPDGMPWSPFVDGCTQNCASGNTMEDNDDDGVAGWLWGGRSLWDESDENGPYP